MCLRGFDVSETMDDRMDVMRTTLWCLPLFAMLAWPAYSQEVIQLNHAAVSGSQQSPGEKEYYSEIWRNRVVTNVTQPTLTVFRPATTRASGTAASGTAGSGTSVIVCPGGGFHALSIDTEGTMVAEWLTARGITAFVLRYRLVATGEDAVRDLMTKDRAKFREDAATVIPLATADGSAAVRYVREHASELGIAPNRIGIIGFSAGGTVAAHVAYDGTAESRADFVAAIYASLAGLPESPVPQEAPPMFVVAASDDPLGLATDSVKLVRAWLDAKRSAELHLFSKGGHGFGMKQQNLPSDRWIDRFGDWLKVQGFLD